MKFTLSWLHDHLETEKSLEQIAEALTSIGLEVEEVDKRTALAPFVIARVLTAEKHPDADRLQVLGVDTGDGKALQVVCGAPNARAGLVGVFAAPGTYIPGLETTLAVGTIRGIESFGMLCSERELLLSDAHDGIIELADNAPLGTPFNVYAGLDDPVIDVSLTPNRADCASVHGIARDLAAAGIGTLKQNRIKPIAGAAAKHSIKVRINSPADKPCCLGFAWRVVKNVKNGPAPEWLQKRLQAVGQNPVNALVDITNYLTFDRGRPLHVFDADKIKGDLVIRQAHEGEKLVALNGREYTLSSRHCVIADDKGVVSISGIMGGARTGCDANTRDVMIESALWDPLEIARTGRELGIISDARYRFERGVDPDFMVPGLELATHMVCGLCGGTAGKMEIAGFKKPVEHKIRLPFSEIRRLTGLDIPAEDVRSILTRLGFGLTGADDCPTVKVPSWRADVHEKADLVEEVMRIYGIGRITPQPLTTGQALFGKILTPLQIRSRNARRALASCGMMEAVTWSFISDKAARLFGDGQAGLKLANPIAADMSDMRPSLLPGLISAARRNADRGFADIALFEVSDIYKGSTAEKQHRVAAGIRSGTAGLAGSSRFWSGNAGTVSVFDAKADALAVLDACGIAADRLQIARGAPSWYHPGRSGVIRLGPKMVLGHFGEFHPETLENLDTDGPLCGFEIFMDAIPPAKKKAGKARPPLALSPLQKITRDFAFVVDKTVPASTIINAAAAADKKQIESVRIFDLFEGKSLGANKKSIAIAVSIQPANHTLTDKEIDSLSQKIIGNVLKTTGGNLRA